MNGNAFQHDPCANPKPHESLLTNDELEQRCMFNSYESEILGMTISEYIDRLTKPIPKYRAHRHPGGLAHIGSSPLIEMVRVMDNMTAAQTARRVVHSHRPSFTFPVRKDFVPNIIMVDDNDIMFMPNHMIAIRSRKNMMRRKRMNIRIRKILRTCRN